MKKIIAIFVTIVVFLIGGITYADHVSTHEFKIYSSMKIGSDNFEHVRLNVIVNQRDYDVEEIFFKVREFYCEEHEPDILEINLYNSKRDLEKSNCHVSRVYEKE